MKKPILFLSLLVLTFASADAQEGNRVANMEDIINQIDPESYNRWTIEASAGMSKGIKPYTEGYFSSNPEKHFDLKINHFALATRYMISPRFGVMLDFAYDNLT